MSFLYIRPKVVFRHRSFLGYKIRPEYAVSCRSLSIAYTDRTQTLDFGFPYSVLDPLPDFNQPFELSFRDLADQRAHELLALSEKRNEPLVVFWSGGIDSTLVLTVLIQAGADRSNLRILYSDSSIEEYPLFFEKVIRDRLDSEILHELITYEIDNGISVTGELGDQVFGLLLTSLNEDGTDHQSLSDDYQPWFLHRLAQGYQSMLSIHARDDIAEYFHHGKPIDVAKKVFEYLEPQLEKSPISIRSVHDLLWWIQMSMKWQPKSLEDIGGIQNGVQSESIQHFFQTPEFQLWSHQNYREAIGENWLSYKWHAKEIIREFTGDDQYAETKTKHNSKQHVTQDVPGAVLKRKNYKAMRHDGQLITSLNNNSDSIEAPANLFSILRGAFWPTQKQKAELWKAERWAPYLIQGTFDEDGMPITVNFSDTSISDSHLIWPNRLSLAKAIFLNDTDISNEGIKNLLNAHKLRGIGLSGTKITNGSAEIFCEFPELVALVLSFTQYSDEGVLSLSRLPNLKRIWLDYTVITPKGLLKFGENQELTHLSLRRTKISDSSLDFVRDLPNLSHLFLDETPITSAGIKKIQRYSSLEVLRCCGTVISEDTFSEFQKYENLKVLDLSLTQTSQTAVENLRQAMPDTNIFR